VVVKVKNWHVIHLEGVVVICILICMSLGKGMVSINCWNYVYVVMRVIAVWGVLHVVYLSVSMKFSQYGLWMLSLYSLDVAYLSKVKTMNNMTDV